MSSSLLEQLNFLCTIFRFNVNVMLPWKMFMAITQALIHTYSAIWQRYQSLKDIDQVSSTADHILQEMTFADINSEFSSGKFFQLMILSNENKN